MSVAALSKPAIGDGRVEALLVGQRRSAAPHGACRASDHVSARHRTETRQQRWPRSPRRRAVLQTASLACACGGSFGSGRSARAERQGWIWGIGKRPTAGYYTGGTSRRHASGGSSARASGRAANRSISVSDCPKPVTSCPIRANHRPTEPSNRHSTPKVSETAADVRVSSIGPAATTVPCPQQERVGDARRDLLEVVGHHHERSVAVAGQLGEQRHQRLRGRRGRGPRTARRRAAARDRPSAARATSSRLRSPSERVASSWARVAGAADERRAARRPARAAASS